MSPQGNNGIWINIKYRKLSGKCITVEYVQRIKRRDSHVKIHRIIIKLHIIVCFTCVLPTEKFPHLRLFWPVPISCEPMQLTRPMPKFDSFRPRTRTLTLLTPPTLFSRLVKLMWTHFVILQFFTINEQATDSP